MLEKSSVVNGKYLPLRASISRILYVIHSITFAYEEKSASICTVPTKAMMFDMRAIELFSFEDLDSGLWECGQRIP